MRKPITMRFDPEVLAQAKRQALRENRAPTNFIEIVVCQRVADSLPATGAPPIHAAVCHPVASSSNDRDL